MLHSGEPLATAHAAMILLHGRGATAEDIMIIVEYGADRGNTWVPHPFTYPQWERIAAQAGFRNTRLLRTIPSRWLGSMYSAASDS